MSIRPNDSSANAFWRPEPSGSDPACFSLVALPVAGVGPPDRQLFIGGCAMGAAVEALEEAIGRPLLWATTHFLSHGILGDAIDIDVETVSGGRNASQAMATLRKEGEVLQRVFTAWGRRDEPDGSSPAETDRKCVVEN